MTRPGWPNSQGARLELTVALALKMPVSFYGEARGLIDMNLAVPA